MCVRVCVCVCVGDPPVAMVTCSPSGVLMATDVLARGVDFPAVDWVLQFDPPSSSK